ncbi:MAG: hypothetical protein Q8918_09845 [Bacteroidota bacterium]|nr:hypothetical protein [Bacteroidota bacterium]
MGEIQFLKRLPYLSGLVALALPSLDRTKSMIPQGPLFHKPKSIIAAKNILYATVFLGILSSLIGEFSAGLQTYTTLQGLVTTILTLGLLIIAIRQIGLGRRWARTVLLVLIIIGLLAAPIYVPFIFRTSMVLGFLFVLQTILQIMALAFLYSRESNTWLNSFKNKAVAAD